MSFVRELKLATDKVKEDAEKVFNRSVAEAFNQVILGTPVDTGQARRSWLYASQNDGSTGTEEKTVTEAEIAPFKGSVVLYANLPYIERLEDGTSQQAPNGMVKVVVGRWKSIVERNGG